MTAKIASQLDSARKASKLRQEDVASKAGITRLTAQRIFSGAVDPRLSTVIEIARSLGLDLMLVPTTLRPDLENFIRSGGRFLAHPAGVSAPMSIVDARPITSSNLPRTQARAHSVTDVPKSTKAIVLNSGEGKKESR